MYVLCPNNVAHATGYNIILKVSISIFQLRQIQAFLMRNVSNISHQ